MIIDTTQTKIERDIIASQTNIFIALFEAADRRWDIATERRNKYLLNELNKQKAMVEPMKRFYLALSSQAGSSK